MIQDVEAGCARMQRIFDRRHATALIGTSLFCPGAARSEIETTTDLSPFRDSPGQPYSPPTNLRTVADIYRRMTAPIKVNGTGPYPFIVDTGANQSVISEELASRLGLPRGARSAAERRGRNGDGGRRRQPGSTSDGRFGWG